MSRPVTLFTGQWADLPLTELAKKAAEWGFDGLFRALNRAGYDGPLSVEWEDLGMDREWGARDAAAFVRRSDFPASQSSFDVAFAQEGHHG